MGWYEPVQRFLVQLLLESSFIFLKYSLILSLRLQFAWCRKYLMFSCGLYYTRKAVSVGEFGKWTHSKLHICAILSVILFLSSHTFLKLIWFCVCFVSKRVVFYWNALISKTESRFLQCYPPLYFFFSDFLKFIWFCIFSQVNGLIFHHITFFLL